MQPAAFLVRSAPDSTGSTVGSRTFNTAMAWASTCPSAVKGQSSKKSSRFRIVTVHVPLATSTVVLDEST
ncbi:MAG TPA: hypothetical protein PKI24_20500, partial [Nitrospira sp.]|uniref:hypothetical protein n=1 Tax=Accumulibacter sp. TaxID=2053492 RepID=UPI002CAAC738